MRFRRRVSNSDFLGIAHRVSRTSDKSLPPARCRIRGFWVDGTLGRLEPDQRHIEPIDEAVGAVGCKAQVAPGGYVIQGVSGAM